MEKPFANGPNTRQVALGLFIVGQLVFLFAANVFRLGSTFRRNMDAHPALASAVSKWTDSEGHLHDAGELLSSLTTRWSEITGQPQNWSLFAPNVTDKIPFVAVEFCWQEDPQSAASLSKPLPCLATTNAIEEASLIASVLIRGDSCDRKKLLSQLSSLNLQQDELPSAFWRGDPQLSIFLRSDNEPPNIHRFFRVGKFRLRRFEASIDVPLTNERVEADEVADSWRESIEDKVREEGKAIEAYLRWRLRRFQEEYPFLPTPKQVILWVRVYRVPKPNLPPEPWNWLGPEQTPVARWQPGVRWQAGHLPVEMYNPVVPRFESLRGKD
jgi:hypothetical protein